MQQLSTTVCQNKRRKFVPQYPAPPCSSNIRSSSLITFNWRPGRSLTCSCWLIDLVAPSGRWSVVLKRRGSGDLLASRDRIEGASFLFKSSKQLLETPTWVESLRCPVCPHVGVLNERLWGRARLLARRAPTIGWTLKSVTAVFNMRDDLPSEGTGWRAMASRTNIMLATVVHYLVEMPFYNSVRALQINELTHLNHWYIMGNVIDITGSKPVFPL